jgi:hypothetical protein
LPGEAQLDAEGSKSLKLWFCWAMATWLRQLSEESGVAGDGEREAVAVADDEDIKDSQNYNLRESKVDEILPVG